MNKDLIFDIWLSMVFMHKNVGCGTLIEKFGSAKKVFIDGNEKIDFSEYPDTVRSAFVMQDLSLAKDVFDDCINNGISVLTYSDTLYPELLKQVDTAPAVLYYKGDLVCLTKPLLTVIGERHPSNDGKQDAAYFSAEIEKSGVGIVTGFADGIESEVLKNTVNPITILPCGINKASPKSNLKYLKRITESGGLCLSEYPSMYAAQPYNYKFRNRLLAGISDSTLVIESGERSGTSITVNFSMLYGRETYALPGSLHSKHYQGNFKYIRNGASLAMHPSEIVYDYYLKYPELVNEISDINENNNFSFDNLDENEKKIIDALREKPLNLDEISQCTRLNIKDVNTSIIMLEMSGYIKCISPDTYQVSNK